MRLGDQYETIARDATLFEERNFIARTDAIELLEVLDLETLSRTETAKAACSGPAREQVEQLIAALEEVDVRLFARLRAEIAAGWHRGEAFGKLLLDYCVVEEGSGYDVLDVFVNRLTSFLPMAVPTKVLEAEMVDYHKTPARIVLELARWVKPGDVFVDLGAGLGQVALLVHLLTGARVRGVEIEPAFCGYARQCAERLGLTGTGPVDGGDGAVVLFVEGDARFANYSEGTVFFMYTPFRGELLATVFELLRQEALSRPFKLVTYGPCTKDAAEQSWLCVVEEINNGMTAFSVSL